MELSEKVKRFREIANELANLYEKKNSNYGDSFGQLYKTLGPISGLVPLHNKLDRATNLIKGDTNHFESIEDTFRDLASYTIMNLIEMEDKDGTDALLNGVITNPENSSTKVLSYEDIVFPSFKGIGNDEEDVEYSNEH